MKKILLSVVIIAKNEERNIEDCLKSVHDWADEIIVVDDESEDNTADIAQRYTDRVVIRKMDIEGKHRNWAYSQAKNDWILSLDADERVTDKLREEISELLRSGPQCEAYTIPRRNYIGNYWLRYGGEYPAPQLKLFRKDKFKFEEVGVHPRAFLEGRCGHLTSDIIHYSYRDFSDYLNKLNSQTTREAEKWIAMGRRMNVMHAFWRAGDRFFYRRMIRNRAYRDGMYGFAVAVFSSLYQIMSYMKYWEMRNSLARLSPKDF